MSILNRVMAAVQKIGKAPATVTLPDRTQQTRTFSRAMTPALITSYFRMADNGDCRRQQGLFDMMLETDPELLGLIQTRAYAVLSNGFMVAGNENDEQSVEAGIELTRQMNNIQDIGGVFAHMLSAPLRGWAVSELVWEIVDGEVILADIVPIAHDWVAYKNNRVMLYKTVYGNDAVEIPPDKTIQTVASKVYAQRVALLRCAAFPWLYRKFAYEQWVQFTETYGQPQRVGKFPDTALPDDVANLITALEQLGTDSIAAIKQSMSIELTEANRASSVEAFSHLIRILGDMLAKVILGQTLTTSQGVEGTGSYALGKIHETVKNDILKADANVLEYAVNTYVVKPWCAWNYPGMEYLPTFTLQMTAGRDLAAKLNEAERLSKIGLPISYDYLYDMFNIPPPEEGESVVGINTESAPNQDEQETETGDYSVASEEKKE